MSKGQAWEDVDSPILVSHRCGLKVLSPNVPKVYPETGMNSVIIGNHANCGKVRYARWGTVSS